MESVQPPRIREVNAAVGTVDFVANDGVTEVGHVTRIWWVRPYAAGRG